MAVVQVVMGESQSSHAASSSQNERLVELLEAGVQLKTAASNKGRRMCHQKCLVVDSSICLLGSANMTHNSRDHAYEFGVCSTQNATVKSCEAKIANLWSHGTLITMDLAQQWLAAKTRSTHR